MKQLRIAALSFLLGIALTVASSLSATDYVTKLAATLISSATWYGTLTQDGTLGGDVVLQATNAAIRANTADGADNYGWYATAGGAVFTDGRRGALLELQGNEAGSAGRLLLQSGNSTGTATFGTRGSGNTIIITGGTTRTTWDGTTGDITTTAKLTSSATSDFGWSVQSAANQACNTTCTSACVVGFDSGSSNIAVGCASATADVCLCAGAS